MLLRDVAPILVIDPAKLTAYALNRNHPRGQHKARLFEAVLGYNLDNYRNLLEEIETKAPDSQAQPLYIDEHGHHYSCLLYTSPSPRDRTRSRMPSSA